ncbi:IclR family transcriptional regulator [Sphingomonas sp. LB-2]|uniref:IclR family transcriptional regulator n=1 Tax=Sphingomonas caeni TaxID=2984949 RepID=UPI002232744A|nr:IclR family transcriptional regulator [Sphingomonas caeni]MCW3849519.1 IclR family transcriptional regulator [Sphingomonas caeni]
MHAHDGQYPGAQQRARMNVQRPKRKYAAPALEKGFEIIELLADYPHGAMVTEMAASLGRSVGEIFRMVVVLEQLGYLQRAPNSDRYTVAYKLLDVAHRATPAANLLGAALPEMRLLASETGQSCHFVVPNAGRGLVIARQENPGMRGFSLRLGAVIDLLRSCSGNTILAFSDPAMAEQIAAEALESGQAPVDPEWLSTQLAALRARGFDRRPSPITYGVTDISFPVFGFDGGVAGALTIPFLELIDGSQKVDLSTATELLRAAAQRISFALGHTKAD